MQILRSRRCRYAIALLLIFAAWATAFWWLMPHRPRFSFATNHQQPDPMSSPDFVVSDISPDNHEALLVSYERWECWELRRGKKGTTINSDDPRWGLPHEFIWDFPAAERFVKFRGTILPSRPIGDEWTPSQFAFELGLNVECFSENRRFWAHSFDSGLAVDGRRKFAPDSIRFFDLPSQREIANMRGTYYPVAISPDGRTAVTASRKGKTDYWLMLEDVATDSLQAELLPIGNDRGRIETVFYSADSQHVFVPCSVWEDDYFNMLTWWNMSGQRVAAVRRSARGGEALVNLDRTVVTLDPDQGLGGSLGPGAPRNPNCEYWDVASGTRLGGWKLVDNSWELKSSALIGSRNGPYAGVFCRRLPGPSVWEKWSWLTKMRNWLGIPKEPSQPKDYLVILNVVEQKEAAHIPANSAQFSRDGRLLVTMDEKGSVSVYDLPLRKPWARIFGFAAIGALATCGGMMGLRRLLRRRSRNTASVAA